MSARVMLSVVAQALIQQSLSVRLFVLAVQAYRRFLSPHKGFACPYRLLHGGDSCSGYALRLLRRHGLARSVPLMQRRFRKCRRAGHKMLAAAALHPAEFRPLIATEDARPGANRRVGWCAHWRNESRDMSCWAAACSSCAPDCGP